MGELVGPDIKKRLLSATPLRDWTGRIIRLGTRFRQRVPLVLFPAMARREERRLVTCLFIDVVGSTELTVALGPERLKGSLDAAFAVLREGIEREGGTVEKYVGDAIYAIFGSPVAHSDDPVRALRAGGLKGAMASGHTLLASARSVGAAAVCFRTGPCRGIRCC